MATYPHKSGYTLVELIIVVSIMAILFTVGYANYRGYQKRQYLETAVRQVIADLRLAQEYALSGRKPVNPPGNACETSTLEGYRFERLDFSSYQILAKCGSGYVVVKGPEDLPQGIEMPNWGGESFVFFRVLGKGVGTTSDIVIRLQWPTGGVNPREITITPGGNIR